MFKDNKYTRVYFTIINRALSENHVRISKSLPNYVYYEKHHILPKSLGGTNLHSNLVLLTPKEHYVCHLLLTKMCKNTFHYQKMVRAWDLLSRLRGNNGYVTSAMYQELKTTMSKIKKEHMIKNNPTASIEVRQKISRANKGRLVGDKNPSKRQDVKDKISRSLRGSGKTSNFGLNNGFFGQQHSEETRKIISEKAKSRTNVPPPPQIGSKNHFAKHYRVITPSGEVSSVHCMKEFAYAHDMCRYVIKEYLNKGPVPVLSFQRLYRVKNLSQKQNCQGYSFETMGDPSGNSPSNE
jgi:hypothetical protein